MTIKSLVQHFGAVEDLRCRGKIRHRLEAILVIAVRGDRLRRKLGRHRALWPQ
jgi:hypothetical protein